ncbi:MAG: 50S ribosomal protein L29 [Crocinitomicaceae bacterium]|nr:50S ribosomal protein L29 [Crocinitomicaceae bacterium]
MKASEIKELSLKDLQEKIETMEEQQAKLLLTHSVSPLENPLELRHNRRTIARLKTALNARQNETTASAGKEKKTEEVKESAE